MELVCLGISTNWLMRPHKSRLHAFGSKRVLMLHGILFARTHRSGNNDDTPK